MTPRTAEPLAATLETEFVPESNVPRRLSNADGRYLRPDVDTRRVVHLGLPRGVGSEVMAGRFAPDARVTVASTDAGVVESIDASGNAGAVHLPSWSALPFAPGSVGHVVVGTGRGAPRPSAYRTLAAVLQRALADDGTVVLETAGYRDGRRARSLGRTLGEVGMETGPVLWLLRISGSVRMAVEEGDLGVARQILDWLGRGASWRRRALRVGVELADRLDLLGPLLSRRRLFFFGFGTAEDRCLWPPYYLRSVLTEAGLDPDRYRAGFHVHGRYDSNKVAFALFDRDGGGAARHLVKCTRAPRFNYRLENEHRSLSLLRERGYLEADAYPEPTVLTHRGGLAVLGLRFVSGRPLREATRGDAGCPLVRGVVRHLEALGTASARRDPASVAPLRRGLDRLFRRFIQLYPVEPADAAFLHRQVRALLDGADELPLVFQHGDAGIWNVLARDRDVVLLDWESADPSGMPLWDLFYFLRSVGSWSSRLDGERDLVRSFEEHFLSGSPLRRLQDRAVARYCRRLTVPEHLVRPLFYTCWMHRALREAMRRSPDALSEGTYYRLLLLAIRRRGDAPGEGAS